MKYLVDLISYSKAMDVPYAKEHYRDGDLFYDYVEMDLTNEKLKQCIDKCVSIKTIENDIA